MRNHIRVSPLQTTIKVKDEERKLFQLELQDLARAFCGALFFALPLHFTMEMWERARVVPYWDLIIILVLTYCLNLGYAVFTSFKPNDQRRSIWYDAGVAMGIGFLASAITMILIEQVYLGIPLAISLKVIAIITVPTSIGAMIAKNSLGGNQKKEKDLSEKVLSVDLRKILGSLLGAFMVALNIAPTIEPIVISSSLTPYHLIGIVIFSLIVSYIMVFFAGFVENDDEAGRIMANDYVETAVAYLTALLVSALLLWIFGYITSGVPMSVIIPWVVTLGYVTTLGASAGRLIL